PQSLIVDRSLLKRAVNGNPILKWLNIYVPPHYLTESSSNNTLVNLSYLKRSKFMFSNNQCPECRKILSDGCNRCTCGWFAISQAKPESLYMCQHRDNGVRCEEIGTTSNRIKGNDWLCSEHARDRKSTRLNS